MNAQRADYLESRFGLTGRRILVVGGRGTIGEGIVTALSSAGAEVLITSRETATLQEAVATYRSKGVNCKGGVAIDVTRIDSIQSGFEEFVRLFPEQRLDGLVVNAGGNITEATIGPNESFFDISTEAGDRAIRLNYSGPCEVCRVFGRLLLNGENPVISFTGSVAHLGLSRVLGYGAGKAALDRLVNFLALHLMIGQERQIRVNGLRVGFCFGTDDKAQNSFARRDASRYQAIMEHIPMGRSATPQEIGDAFVFLQCQASSYVHGTMVSVDGGWQCNRLGKL